MRRAVLLLSAVPLIAASATAQMSAAPRKPARDAGGAVAEASVGPVATPAAARPQIGKFGFDEAGMDRSAAPGDDFARYAGGKWEAVTEIPADRATFGMFNVLQDLSESRTRTILDAEQKTPGSKTGDLYASFMDESAAEAKGAAPLAPTIAAIRGAKTRDALAAQMGRLQRVGVAGPFRASVEIDDKDPNAYIVGIRQSGLGLPDRDYYLKDDPKLVATRTEYAAHLTRLMALAGQPNADARVKAVVAFETQLAQVQWTRIQSRDRDAAYNRWSAADFARTAPGFAWPGFFAGAGIRPQAAYIVAQPTAFTGMAKAFAAAPLPVLKDYVTLRALESYAPFLSRKFVDEQFGFSGTTLSGTPENRARWKRGVTLTSNLMGEAVGQKYVAAYFPPEAKAAADELVRNVIAAMDHRIETLTWMAPETKVKARAKLAAFTPKIGFPDKWRDYSALTIDRGDLVGNVMRGREFDYQRDIDKLGTPMDRSEWGMTPMTINAYANPVWNEIVFPAAILQPPFFDPKADPAVNYGGIGAVIGHEISHHFDDQGRKYDKTGTLTDWWTPADVARFKALTDRLVAQYDAYEPIPGQHVQGGLTLGENIGDLAGLTIAHEAYLTSLGGKPAPVIDGFTGDQRFYLGWAQVWRSKYREPALRQQLLSDPHAPGQVRTEVVRNLDPWYAAFRPAPGGKIYLAPDDRVRIW